MKAWVVYESAFGNTRQLAEAVARGLGDAEVINAEGACFDRLRDLDLLVLGGPTHAFSMSRSATRREARAQGGTQATEAYGMREFIANLPPRVDVRVATFDTRIFKARRFPGSAARSAAHALRRHHHATVLCEESFYVEDTSGPLIEGELDRARQWGSALRTRMSSGRTLRRR